MDSNRVAIRDEPYRSVPEALQPSNQRFCPRGRGAGGAARAVGAHTMPTVDRGPLGDDIDAFVDAVELELAELSHRAPASHHGDVVLEAANIVAAAFDADGRITDDESWAYVHGIGAVLEPAVIC